MWVITKNKLEDQVIIEFETEVKPKKKNIAWTEIDNRRTDRTGFMVQLDQRL